MRPRRIIRRFIARARNWGTPHVHCPSCGADTPIPEASSIQTCFTCKVEWFRHELSGDIGSDWETIERRVGDGRRWTSTWRPIVVDTLDSEGRNTTRMLDCVFVYFPDTKA